MKKLFCAVNDRYTYDDNSQVVDGISGTYNMPLGHDNEYERLCIMRALDGVRNAYKEDDGSATALAGTLNLKLQQKRSWHFLTTGSEAVEKAVMCAMPRGGKLVVMEGAFHGKSFFTAKAHYTSTPWKWPFEVIIAPWGRPEMLPPHFDALLFEPVQGWTGRAMSDDHMHELKLACRRRDAVLIADEILCGLYRAGRRLYSELVEPDIVTVAKGMAGSIPISAVGLLHGDKAPLVGWTSTHANNSLANKTADAFLPAVLDAGWRASRDFELLWRDAFPGARITGTLAYIPTKRPTPDVVRDLRDAGFLVADHNPYLRLCPCYTMSKQTQLDFIDAIVRLR